MVAVADHAAGDRAGGVVAIAGSQAGRRARGIGHQGGQMGEGVLVRRTGEGFSRRELTAPNAHRSIRRASLDQGSPSGSARRGGPETNAQHGPAEWTRHPCYDHSFHTSVAIHCRNDGRQSRSVAHHSKHDRKHILTSISKSGP